MNLTLHRLAEQVNSTFGQLKIDHMTHPTLWTCEDLWHDNKPRQSCIPAGVYKCEPHAWKPNNPFKFQKVWQVMNVPNREAVLIHTGNTNIDTIGCILVGFDLDTSYGVKKSKAAIAYLQKVIGEKPFTLTIKDDILE